jgi:predicted ABC-type ATPase
LSYLKFINEAKTVGYNITFFFVYLNSIELAKNRVAIRVSKGGHSIPEDVISRRYPKGLQNFIKYAEIADDWYLYDNSGGEYKLVAKSIFGIKEIVNFTIYNKVVGYES